MSPSEPEPPAGQRSTLVTRHPFLVYNLARLAILAVALGVFYLVGFRGLALVLVALLVSGAISFVALSRLANQAGASFVSAWRRLGQRLDERTRAEDED